ncbi:MAG: hypothetical protein K6U08_02995 [Firmicutes bacterium]|nr:hypothetical protein [Bacillota bacterium]
MGVFWFVAGAVSVGALLYIAAVSRPAWAWWKWVLVILFDAWCVFGLALSVTTYAEGNSKGGGVLLAIALGVTVVAVIILRALLRLGTGAQTQAK